jgi:hypothetical protein
MHPRLFRLLQKHQKLDEQLHLELARRWPDLVRIRRLRERPVPAA